MKKKWIAVSILSVLCGAVIILICTFFGAADITIKDTLITLANRLCGLFDEEAAALGSKTTIIWSLRFPRSLLAFRQEALYLSVAAYIRPYLKILWQIHLYWVFPQARLSAPP